MAVTSRLGFRLAANGRGCAERHRRVYSHRRIGREAELELDLENSPFAAAVLYFGSDSLPLCVGAVADAVRGLHALVEHLGLRVQVAHRHVEI